MEILIGSLIIALLLFVYINRDLTWDKLKKKKEKPLEIKSKRKVHGSPRKSK